MCYTFKSKSSDSYYLKIIEESRDTHEFCLRVITSNYKIQCPEFVEGQKSLDVARDARICNLATLGQIRQVAGNARRVKA